MTADPHPPWLIRPIPPEQVTAIQDWIDVQVREAVARTLRDAYEAALGDPDPVRRLEYYAEHHGIDLDGDNP